MKERPILMSAPMVSAILEGSKSQTRRVLKQPKRKDGCKLVPELLQKIGVGEACPYGAIGDRLWVKERVDYTVVETQEGSNPADILTICGHVYAADGQEVGAAPNDFKGWKPKTVPSTFMPRWASRLTLEITDVRIERLNEISDVDVWDEGVRHSFATDIDGQPWIGNGKASLTNRNAYRDLWESINGKGSWALNPWVWVLTFKKLSQSPTAQ